MDLCKRFPAHHYSTCPVLRAPSRTLHRGLPPAEQEIPRRHSSKQIPKMVTRPRNPTHIPHGSTNRFVAFAGLAVSSGISKNKPPLMRRAMYNHKTGAIHLLQKSNPKHRSYQLMGPCAGRQARACCPGQATTLLVESTKYVQTYKDFRFPSRAARKSAGLVFHSR